MDYPILKPQCNGLFEVYEEYNLEDIKVPKGFVTDGLTLKNRLIRVIVDKYQPKFAPFFVIHDLLTNRYEYYDADKIGSKILFEIENSIRTKLMMFVIKLYHRIKYGIKPQKYWGL